MESAITVNQINKNYQKFSLKNVSFEVPKGYISGFIGPNGAGKTTTLKAILGMVQLDSGHIATLPTEEIGIVMDNPMFVEDWTLTQVEKALKPFYGSWDMLKYAQYLKRFKLEPTKKVKELSRGMKVKLMMAVALSHGAKLLLLDEPTSGLDPVARDELCEILAEFVTNEENTVLFSTHITSDLEKIADYLTFILNGEIFFSGPKEELLESYALIKGDSKDLDALSKNQIIGLRTYSHGFEGLIRREDSSSFPESVLIEEANLEEIIVFINKEAGRHE